MDFSFISSSDNSYIDQLYQRYRNDPSAVEESWHNFFKGFDLAMTRAAGDLGSEGPGSLEAGSLEKEDIDREFRIYRLIQSYRARGHLLAKTNPVRERKDRHPHLALSDYGLSTDDLEHPSLCGQYLGLGKLSLKKIIEHMEKLYCSSIGVEYMHCNDTEIRRWFRDYYETSALEWSFPLEKKKRILSKLDSAVIFENFLHTKFVGQKRFSLEGGENAIPALDAIINRSAQLGAEEVVIGMAHRGRLNVLANIMGKTYEYIFSEFEGQPIPDSTMGDGDVKYHLGFHSQTETPSGEKVYLKLMPNPSHLEAVGPVVMGYARAQSDILYSENLDKIVPIIIHGDAAVAGQGVVYEMVQMSQLPGYQVGGTIHLVINNQIGFTTDFDDARSSYYCTSVARTINVPILHVNGDDAEAVVYAVELATEFRQKFHQDIFIDMVCYRKHGHNEGDEPKYTQPDLYKKISKQKNPQETYRESLIQGNSVEKELADDMEKGFKQRLQDRFQEVKQNPIPYEGQPTDEEWKSLRPARPEDFEDSPETAVELKLLDQIMEAITSVPDGINPIRKAKKLLEDRKKKYADNELDWALGELLAYGSLCEQGVSVRMAGQDSVRGTFSHRHAKIFDQEGKDSYCGLNHISEKQAKFRIYNSLLSEYAALGFEYGYSLGRPTDINIWEAQFGDFANGAQVVIDQFLSSAESKWQRMSGLFMFLPHGYEGQGPEHSNARPERFLQLCAEYNMIVANCTTPANFFHLIRRQTAWPFRKPIIVMTPKSLLRHPRCVSTKEDLTNGKFQEFLLSPHFEKQRSKLRRVLLCSGKVYYDLLSYQEEHGHDDVAIIRLEQVYPLPLGKLGELLQSLGEVSKMWVQEEPINMGAWSFLLRYDLFHSFHVTARKESASPATGFSANHKKEQQNLMEKSFAK